MIDGLLLIVAHATMSPMGEGCYNTPSNTFYRHVYDSKYVYGVWLIEVYMPCIVFALYSDLPYFST